MRSTLYKEVSHFWEKLNLNRARLLKIPKKESAIAHSLKDTFLTGASYLELGDISRSN
jgi:hypothetical protein